MPEVLVGVYNPRGARNTLFVQRRRAIGLNTYKGSCLNMLI